MRASTPRYSAATRCPGRGDRHESAELVRLQRQWTRCRRVEIAAQPLGTRIAEALAPKLQLLVSGCCRATVVFASAPSFHARYHARSRWVPAGRTAGGLKQTSQLTRHRGRRGRFTNSVSGADHPTLRSWQSCGRASRIPSPRGWQSSVDVALHIRSAGMRHSPFSRSNSDQVAPRSSPVRTKV